MPGRHKWSSLTSNVKPSFATSERSWRNTVNLIPSPTAWKVETRCYAQDPSSEGVVVREWTYCIPMFRLTDLVKAPSEAASTRDTESKRCTTPALHIPTQKDALPVPHVTTLCRSDNMPHRKPAPEDGSATKNRRCSDKRSSMKGYYKEVRYTVPDATIASHRPQKRNER